METTASEDKMIASLEFTLKRSDLFRLLLYSFVRSKFIIITSILLAIYAVASIVGLFTFASMILVGILSVIIYIFQVAISFLYAFFLQVPSSHPNYYLPQKMNLSDAGIMIENELCKRELSYKSFQKVLKTRKKNIYLIPSPRLIVQQHENMAVPGSGFRYAHGLLK